MALGLLGRAAAGAAIGAADVSNKNLAAEQKAASEALRQKYRDMEYKRARKDAKEDASAAAMSEQSKFERDRAAKKEDAAEDREFKASESAKNRRSKESIAAANRDAKKGKGDGGAGNAIELPDGTVFTPTHSDGKAAVDLVKSGQAEDLNEAYEIVYANKYASQAAGSIEGLTEGVVPAARDMSRNLLGRNKQAPREFALNPKTGRYEPKQ